MNLSLPLNFGERPCDRALLANFRVGPGNLEGRNNIMWQAFLVWRDFGIARDDRRTVPLDPAARAACQVVAIIEQFIGFPGEPGRFVQFAIDAGFFLLVPIDEREADLVLVDFFPANHTAARDISSSKLGGIAKSVNIARRDAEVRAKEQLGLFERTDGEVVRQHGKERFKEALFFVNQICRILGLTTPVAAEWKQALAVKALAVLDSTTEEERESVFKWFVANRGSQEIPPRLDLILVSFPDFVSKGRRDFRLV